MMKPMKQMKQMKQIKQLKQMKQMKQIKQIKQMKQSRNRNLDYIVKNISPISFLELYHNFHCNGFKKEEKKIQIF